MAAFLMWNIRMEILLESKLSFMEKKQNKTKNKKHQSKRLGLI